MKMLWLGMAASCVIALGSWAVLQQFDWSSSTVNTSTTSNVRL